MTEDLPEIRASDAEREQTAEILRGALAEGRLEMDEFQERLDETYRARTHGQLVKLVRDLPTPEGQGAAGGSLAVSGASASGTLAERRRWADRIGGTATSRWAVGFLGGFGRRGRWVVPRVFTAIGLMGGGQLDLREARFEEREVVIRCFALWGGVHVIVPTDVELQVRGVGIMGGFDSSVNAEGAPGAPRVVVTGFAIWGGVGVDRKRAKQDPEADRGGDRKSLE